MITALVILGLLVYAVGLGVGIAYLSWRFTRL